MAPQRQDFRRPEVLHDRQRLPKAALVPAAQIATVYTLSGVLPCLGAHSLLQSEVHQNHWPRQTLKAACRACHTIESTREARISLTILDGCESRNFRMFSMTDISVAVVSCNNSQHSFRAGCQSALMPAHARTCSAIGMRSEHSPANSAIPPTNARLKGHRVDRQNAHQTTERGPVVGYEPRPNDIAAPVACPCHQGHLQQAGQLVQVLY